MAIDADELNLFTSDPTLLERSPDAEYERAASALARIADPERLKLLHALCLDADTPQKAAVWAGLSQAVAERELGAMVDLGLVERKYGARGTTYVPRDGHLVVQLHVALAHGREDPDGQRHPRLIARRRVVRARTMTGAA
jgi:DNA-binding transcriptional ArsR family regulator